MIDPEQPPPLPPVYRSRISLATLRDLLSDIEHGADLLEARLRGPAERRGALATVSLTDAAAALLDGSAASIQLRYRHKGVLWFDTVQRYGADEFDLVRIQHQAPPALPLA